MMIPYQLRLQRQNAVEEQLRFWKLRIVKKCGHGTVYYIAEITYAEIHSQNPPAWSTKTER